MRHRLLEFLVCPVEGCASTVEVNAFRDSADGHIEEGLLTCSRCGAQYPIIGCVPRMLTGAAAEILLELYPEFFATHAARIDRQRLAGGGVRVVDEEPTSSKKGTQRSFGFEWTRFAEMIPEWERNFLDYMQPFDRSFFSGKLVLDAGCGMGRHAHYSAKFGAEVIGVDLSMAVDSAFRNTRQFTNAHIVQGDLFHAPLRPNTFDFGYSLGVMPTLESPEAMIRRISAYLKPGARLRVYAYSDLREKPLWYRGMNKVSRALRLVTPKLPHKVMHQLTLPIAAVLYTSFVVPYRAARAAGLADRVPNWPFRAYADYPLYTLQTDVFDRFAPPIESRHSQEQVQTYLEAAGMEDVSVLPHFGWLGTGTKPQSAKATNARSGRASNAPAAAPV